MDVMDEELAQVSSEIHVLDEELGQSVSYTHLTLPTTRMV